MLSCLLVQSLFCPVSVNLPTHIRPPEVCAEVELGEDMKWGALGWHEKQMAGLVVGGAKNGPVADRVER